jgi:hypothetical protein
MIDSKAEVINDPIVQMASETLLTLNGYSEVLETLSVKASELVGQTEFQDEFLKLIEGIETFAESIVQVKAVLNSEPYETVKVLESDLASILKNLLASQEHDNLDQKRTLLKIDLPTNLVQWRTTGIPAIRNPRDC